MQSMYDLTEEQKANLIKSAYPQGTRIKLCHVKGDDIPYGTKGTILYVDNLGHLHIRWDNGKVSPLTERDTFSTIQK